MQSKRIFSALVGFCLLTVAPFVFADFSVNMPTNYYGSGPQYSNPQTCPYCPAAPTFNCPFNYSYNIWGPYGQNAYSNNLAFTNADLGMDGPLSFNVQHSSQFGWILGGGYLQAINDFNAFNLAFEGGPNENREAATWGWAFAPNQRIKFTGERLQETLPFEFATGEVDKSVPQYAGGAQYQYLFNRNCFFQDINFGGYYAQAQNQSLDSITFTQNGLNFIDQRSITGGKAGGFNVGTDLYPWPNSVLSASLNFDTIRFSGNDNTNTNNNKNELGFTVGLKQLLFWNHAQAQVFASHRAIYDEYGGGVGWITPVLSRRAALTIDVDGMTLRNIQGVDFTDNRVMVNFGLTWNHSNSSNPGAYTMAQISPCAEGIRGWTSTPAVYMAAVAAQASENIKPVPTPGPGPGPGPNPTPSGCPSFNPLQLTVWPGHAFSSSVTLPGTGLSLSYTTTVRNSGIVTPGTPSWVNVSTSESGGNTIVTLSGLAQDASQGTTFQFAVTASNNPNCHPVFNLTVPQVNLQFTQTLNNMIPAQFSLVLDTLTKGQYKVQPPQILNNQQQNVQFVDVAQGSAIAGEFIYRVVDPSSPVNGEQCDVKYVLDYNGNFTTYNATGSNFVNPVGPIPQCTSSTTSGPDASATLNIVP